MELKGKRIFNYRPMCVFAVFLILGIIVGESLFGEQMLFRLIPLIISMVAIVLCAIFAQSRKFVYILIAFLIGFLAICGSNDIFSASLIDAYRGEIEGSVSSEIVVDGSVSFEIDDITIDGKTISYKASVYFDVDAQYVPSFGVGDIIKIEGTLNPVEHEKFSTFYGTSRANGVGYSVYATSVTKLADADAKFPLNIQTAIKQIFDNNLDAHTASICKALVLGDKTGMSDELYDSVKASGLAHVLAVSGLHVTTLAGAIYFALKKLKFNPKVAYIIVVLLTLFYSMLCSFTASSLRAVVMTAVCGFASAYGKKGDNLSSLALAACIILIVRPTALLEIGFHLSFFAVLGIFLFYRSFKKTGMVVVDKLSPKKHRGEKLVDACALTLAANVMTYPLVAHFFKQIPTMFLVSSVVVLPYVVFVYVITLIITLFSLITGLHGGTVILKYLLIPFRAYVGGVGSLSIATIDVSMTILGVLLFLFMSALLSKFVFVKRSTKAKILLSATSIHVMLCALIAAI